MSREATIQRKTGETNITVSLVLDGTGTADVKTGVGFFDHMLTHVARHGLFDLRVHAEGDLHIDPHHTVEDVGLALGQALARAAGDKAGIRRYGHFTLPMDETLATAAVDLAGRPAFVFNVAFTHQSVGTFDTQLVAEFFKSLANEAKLNLHIHVPYGGNDHHIAEAIFKAVARALRMALEKDDRVRGVPSTKGTLSD